MKKLAIIYWSGTGNTEAMAEAVAQGGKDAGAEVTMFTPDGFSPDLVKDFDAFAFGCPSMGAEVLEESEFQPMWDDCVGSLSGKTLGLFGSYGWGDGEWMRTWEDDCKSAGINLGSPSVICNETPDDSGLQDCKSLGFRLTA